MLTTGFSFDGYKITRYFSPICVRHVDTDLFLYKTSGRWDEIWDEKHGNLMDQLLAKANAIGANAVVGIGFEYVRSVGVITLIATGTAVTVEPL